jgi:hypothetical protein
MWVVVGALAVVALLAGKRLAPGERAEAPPIVLGSDAVAHAWGDTAMTPYLLRRLAAAAGGFHEVAGEFWLVVHPEPPHHVVGQAFASLAAADSFVASQVPDHEVYGPFILLDGRIRFGVARIICHTPWTELCQPLREEILEGAFDRVRIEWWDGDELRGETEYDAGRIDVIVFSPRAYDRFLYPFYVSEHGAERAFEMRREHLGLP